MSHSTSESAASSRPAPRTMDILEIMSILPHRYPFLLIDRILEIEPRRRVVAIKNVTASEPHFAGHFPDYPIMPGVLMVEAIAQAGGALLMDDIPDPDSKLMVFTGIEGAKFRRPVVPGDQLRIEVSVVNWRTTMVKMRGVAMVDGKIACEATVTCAVVPRKPKPATSAAPSVSKTPNEVQSEAEMQPVTVQVGQ